MEQTNQQEIGAVWSSDDGPRTRQSTPASSDAQPPRGGPQGISARVRAGGEGAVYDATVYVTLSELEKDHEPIPNYNPYADPTHTFPPLLPRDYSVRVEYVETQPDKRWLLRTSNRYSRKVCVAHLNIFILEGPFAGRVVPVDVTTFTTGRYPSKAEELGCALGLGGMVRRCKSMAALIRLLTPPQNELGSCVAFLEWRVWHRSHKGKTTDFDRMRQFPKDADGNYVWQFETSDGAWFNAENYVRAWKPCLAAPTEAPALARRP